MALLFAKSISGTLARRHQLPSHESLNSWKRRSQIQASPSSPRHISSSAPFAYPRKDSQDKDSINTEATEYSKSATDDESARQGDAAFDPNITDPQEQHAKAGEGQGVSIQTFLNHCFLQLQQPMNDNSKEKMERKREKRYLMSGPTSLISILAPRNEPNILTNTTGQNQSLRSEPCKSRGQ